MMYLAVTLLTLMLVFAMMAVGLILRGKPIKGTCASLSNIGMKEGCEICGGDADKCESSKTTLPSVGSSSTLYTDAAARRD